MLKLDLPRLEREGALTFEGVVPPDDPLWAGSDLRFEDGLRVRGQATVSGSGEFVVRVHLSGTRVAECRRCLEPVRIPLDRDLILVYGSPSDEGVDEASEIRPVADEALKLDLSEAVREELILATDRWVECRPDCAGLCPHCGVNRNEQTCDCSPDEPDPRWDALRALKSE